ncbi:MAG: hypothetical protein M1535_05895 [Candidatus Thermoplasmatota archaeon]|jgi:hypothetical protein|nr:hypothetical protein [Candidatus Thermoplasmatota archaeon]
MQELICNIEFIVEDDEQGGETTYTARLRTDMGGLREYVGFTFEDALNQVMIELEQEFS